MVLVAGVVAALQRRSEPANSGSPNAGSASPGAAQRTRGRVVSFTGDTLTLRSKGSQVVVTVSQRTRYGNAAHPATRADIRPGVVVIVVGPHSNPTRVLLPVASSTPSPSATRS